MEVFVIYDPLAATWSKSQCAFVYSCLTISEQYDQENKTVVQ